MDKLSDRYKEFIDQEQQVDTELRSVLNRSIDEYCITTCQIIGILDTIKADYLGMYIEPDEAEDEGGGHEAF